MQLSAILLSRAIAFFDVADTNQGGGLFFPDVIKGMIQRFNFQKYPRTMDEWSDSNGAVFTHGKSGEIVVDNFTIFRDGMQVDTHSNTSDSRQILEQTLVWAKEDLQISSVPPLNRWAYLSGVTFFSNGRLLSTPPLDKLAERTSGALSEILGESIVYQPMTQTVGHDPLTRKHGRAAFTIQRRLEVPFADNKYFSEAPLPTDLHLELLEQFERDTLSL